MLITSSYISKSRCYNISPMKKKFKIKGVTLDDLAAMTQRGFIEINDKMKSGFAEVHEKMDKRFDDAKKDLHEFKEETKHHFNFIQHRLISKNVTELEHIRDKVLQLEVKVAKLSK